MIIVCDPDPEFRTRVVALLDDAQAPTQLADLAAMRAAVDHAVQPTAVVLGPALDLDACLSFASGLEAAHRPVAVVLVRPSLDTGVMRRALHMGVSDVLVASELAAAELSAAVERAHDDARDRAPTAAAVIGESASQGTVVTIFSTKGGCGKSLVASNLAILLSQAGNRVALVDLDLQSGDLAIMLQVMPSLTIYEASLAIDRMDVEALKGYLTPHPSGIWLLAAPLEPSLAEAVTAPGVTTMIGLLREAFDFIVVDGPAFFTDQILAAMDQSAHVVLVGSLDVPSVKNLRTALTTLHQLGHPRDQILTVLNRADSNVGLRIQEVEKSLGTAIDVQLPSNRDVPLSINQGSPLAADRPRSDVVQAIGRLLPKLGVDADTASKSRFARRR